jgi:hypothetical protein
MRSPDSGRFAREELDLEPLFFSLQPGEFLKFTPGEAAVVVSSLHHEKAVAVYVSKDELVLHNGMRTVHCRVGEASEPRVAKLPRVTKLVMVFIHRQPVLPGPARYLYALDASDAILAKVDDTGTWEFRTDLVARACGLIQRGRVV